MGELFLQRRDASRPPKRMRSLASKFSLFTGILVAWVVTAILLTEWHDHEFKLVHGLALCILVVFVAIVIARFTIRLIAQPLRLLRDGIDSVKNGRLEPIQISRTGDEIEDLGETFNEMIRALSESRAEVRRYQHELEDRIRQRTEDVEAAMHQALAASQAKSEFLANVSHELRTPMNGVIGMLDIVLETRLAADQRDHLQTAQRCAYSLLAIVNDLLDLSKIEAGKMALEKVAFNLRELLDQCVAAHAAVAATKGFPVHLSVSTELPDWIAGDPLRIRQVIDNLLSNAVKFTDAGAVSVTADASSRTETEIEVRITVRDTGSGIPAHKLPVIFEKFTQADGSVSRKYGGTGLGLAITRKLVEMHGGSIDVESQPGDGSTFTVHLKCELPRFEPAADQPSPRGLSDTPRGIGRILVVEDNLVNQKVVTAILRKRGYQPMVANNGREALEMLSGAPDPRHYGLVLMDVQMPVLDGLQATRIIRADSKWDHLPIVAMTAHAMDTDRDACMQAGMNWYVSKPVNHDALISTIERFLSRPAWNAGIEPAPKRAAPPPPDSDLVQGMTNIFLQLAPERIERLSAAARCRDASKLLEETHKISSAAQRIAAVRVSHCTRELEDAANAQDYEHVQNSLMQLAQEISMLQQNASVS